MNHPLADLTADLRWAEFPSNAKDTIAKIDQVYHSMKKSSKMNWNPEPVVLEMVNQFVFNLYDCRDLKRSRLTTIQKLHLAEIITSYLSTPGNEADRQNIFNTIFYSSNFHNGDVPLLVLSLVTSLAIAFRNSEALKCIGAWMVSAGIDSPAVLYIASDVTKDLVTDEDLEKYNHLPKTASLFTAVLLIAIGRTFRSLSPPPRLVKQVTFWLETCPSVCFIPPHSAIFEIFRWCMNSEEDQSRLHFTLISAVEREGKGAQLQVIPHVMTLIQELRVKRENAISMNNNGALTFNSVESCVDRLFQLIQILISSECLDSNEIHPIFEAAGEAGLPSTEFFEMMKRIYLK